MRQTLDEDGEQHCKTGTDALQAHSPGRASHSAHTVLEMPRIRDLRRNPQHAPAMSPVKRSSRGTFLPWWGFRGLDCSGAGVTSAREADSWQARLKTLRAGTGSCLLIGESDKTFSMPAQCGRWGRQGRAEAARQPVRWSCLPAAPAAKFRTESGRARKL